MTSFNVPIPDNDRVLAHVRLYGCCPMLHVASAVHLAAMAGIASTGWLQPRYILDGKKCATYFCHGHRVLDAPDLPDDYDCGMYEAAFCQECNEPKSPSWLKLGRCVACVQPQSGRTEDHDDFPPHTCSTPVLAPSTELAFRGGSG